MSLTPQQFALRMQDELDENQNKGDWAQWRPDVEQALYEVHDHVSKLHATMMLTAIHDTARITELCTDVANHAMKIAELYGS